MRQTESAMRMLICAYRAVLSNCFNKEFLRGGVKRLAKGAALGTFLTAVLAGFSSSYSYAETIYVSEEHPQEDYYTNKEYGFSSDDAKGDIISSDNAKLNIGFTGEGEDQKVETSNIDIKNGTNGIVAQGVNANIQITVKNDIAIDKISEKGINAQKGSEVHLTAGNTNVLYVNGVNGIGINVSGKVNISQSQDKPEFKQSKVSLISTNGNNEIKSENGIGVKVDSARFQAISHNASNIISGGNIGIEINNQGSAEISAIKDNFIGDEDQVKNPVKHGVWVNDWSVINLMADQSNNICTSESGLFADKGSTAIVTLHYHESDESNLEAILSNNIFVNKEDYNDNDVFAVKAMDGSTIELTSQDNTETTEQDKKYIPTINTTINVKSVSGDIIGIIADDSTNETGNKSLVKIDGSSLIVHAEALGSDNSSEKISAIESIGNGKIISKVDASVLSKIYVDVSGNAKLGYGLKAENGGAIELKSTNGGSVNINVDVNTNEKQTGYGIYSSGNVDVSSVKNIIIASLDGVNFSSGTVDITSMTTSSLSRSIDKVSDYNIIIGKEGTGVHAAEGADGEFNAIATSGNNYIAGYENAVCSESSKEVKTPKILITAVHGSNFIGFDKDVYEDGVIGKNGLLAKSGEVSLIAGINNDIKAFERGIYVNNAKVNLKANEFNIITADKISEDNPMHEGFGNGYAIYSLSGSSVTLDAGNKNSLLGAVYAEGANTSVSLTGKSNTVSSYAQSSSSGDLSDEPAFADKKVISALYAEQGANISLTGDSNILRTYAEYDNDEQLERVVWAYNGKEGEKKGSSISIDGYSYISTDSYEKSPNSLDVAIAAGTATKLDFNTVNKEVNPDDRATVTVTYADTTDEEGNLQHSFISGDILAAYEGLIDITPKDGSARITINGNLLAGNNGIVNVNLGQGGILTGRADDYGDAGVLVGTTHGNGVEGKGFFNPAFSSTIYKGGEVNLTMGEGSRWNVTGQSWITRINTENSSNAIIDLVSTNTDRNETAHALTVYELTGNAIFNMSLDADRDVSDMLYIKNANGEYTVNVIDAVSHDDMYADGLDGLRFATVGAGSKAKFRALTYNGGGVNNIEYQIGTDAYAENDENSVYNGDNMSVHKPGDSTVDEFFESSGKPGEAIPTPATQTLSLAAVNVLASDSEVTVLAEKETAAPAAESGLDEVTNFKLVGVESTEISDAGKTIVDMSRANYANAVYMDTLNKRQGEARFVGNTDHGVWVRLRHDNIGKDDSFRTHDTMVEVGFDQRDIVDSGEFHTGLALDYMNGQIDYHTVDGDGDIERYGIWFYTTYLGNDGQYADLVLKYGHLKNDFDFNLDMTGVNVNGDYTNEVASISAEYGWKFSNSYNYYIEPQAQLQYSYVTGADYTTSYGTKVDLDSIHSLIGRIGFRAGKDFNTDTPITAYIRGDVLHEFLGDQDIYAYDNTGVMDVTYENDDTWYSAGLGISVQSSENTYFFLEGEQVFGADNDNTYTVSGGFKHSF